MKEKKKECEVGKITNWIVKYKTTATLMKGNTFSSGWRSREEAESRVSLIELKNKISKQISFRKQN